MKKVKNKINEDEKNKEFHTDIDFSSRPFVEVTEDGRLIYKVEGFRRYQKIHGTPFATVGAATHPLDFNTVYKWPNLKQTNYQVILNPVPLKIPGVAIGQYEFCSNKAMWLSDIKIKLSNKISTLMSYVDDKKSGLEMFVKAHDIRNGNRTLGNKYYCLGSNKISRLLSIGSSWDKMGNTSGGNPNIFESEELLDQLVIAILIWFTKEGHSVSHDILLALLANGVRRFTRKLIGNIRDFVDCQEFEDEALTLTSQIILNKCNRFRFVPTNFQSLQHWLLGKGVPIEKRNGKVWIPKLQEYFKDKLEKYYFESNHRFTTSEIEEKKISLEKIKDEKSKEDVVLRKSDIIILKDKLNQLPLREQDIIHMWSNGIPLEIIGEKYDIKKARVSQIIKEQIRKLRKFFTVH